MRFLGIFIFATLLSLNAFSFELISPEAIKLLKPDLSCRTTEAGGFMVIIADVNGIKNLILNHSDWPTPIMNEVITISEVNNKVIYGGDLPQYQSETTKFRFTKSNMSDLGTFEIYDGEETLYNKNVICW